MPVKIAYVSDVLSIHDYRFLQKLSDSQHAVWLITYFNGSQLPSSIRTLPNIKVIHSHSPSKWNLIQYRTLGQFKQLATHLLSRAYLRLSRNGVPLLRKPFDDWLTTDRKMLTLLAAYSFRSYQSLPHFTKTLHAIKPDVVHAGWVQSSGMLTALSDFHPFLLMPWGSDILRTPDRSADDMSMTQLALAKADMITCDCETVKRRISAISGYPDEKFVVIPWGIDLNLFNPEADGGSLKGKLNWDDKQVLISTRSLSPVYAIDLFLRALPQVIKERPDTRALIVGDGPAETELRDLADRLELSDYVHFSGLVPNEELPMYLNAADVYVTTSLSDGTSLSLLEAMACGLPVVVPDLPAYREWIENGVNGFIVPPRDPKAIADKLLALLQNGDLARQMGKRNLELARQKADWDRNFEKLESTYSQLVRLKSEPVS